MADWKLDEARELIASRLKELRLRLGWKQEQMAGRLHIHLSTYQRWERWGPPKTAAHLGYIRRMIREIRKGDLLGKVRREKTKARKRDARIAAAADE